MSGRYQIWSGDRPVVVLEAQNAYAALLEYVRWLGFRDPELMRLGDNALSWRGAVFRATPAAEDAGSVAAERHHRSAVGSG